MLNENEYKEIPPLKGEMITTRKRKGILFIEGYRWIYSKKRQDVQRFGIFPIPMSVSDIFSYHMLEGLEGVPLPVYRRNDIKAGNYKESTNAGFFDLEGYDLVTYKSGENKKDHFVYKHGIEKSYMARRKDEEPQLSLLSFYEMGQVKIRIYISPGGYITEIIRYESGLIKSKDSLVGKNFNQRELFFHGSYKGAILDGYLYRYTVKDSKFDINNLKVINGELIFPLLIDQVVDYFHTSRGKLEGSFWIPMFEVEGTFNGKIDCPPDGNLLKEIFDLPPEEYAEGYLRIGDKEYYITLDGEVLPYNIWLSLVSGVVEKEMGSVPGIREMVSSYAFESPRREKFLLPPGGYQSIIKSEIQPITGKQDIVTKTILEYLKRE